MSQHNQFETQTSGSIQTRCRLLKKSLHQGDSLSSPFNCPKGLLCRGGSRKSCVSVRPLSGLRCPVSGLRVRTIFDPVSELENEDTSAISEKKRSEKGPKCDIWFQVRDGSRPKNNSNLVTFRTSQDSDEALIILVRLPFGRPCSAGQF